MFLAGFIFPVRQSKSLNGALLQGNFNKTFVPSPIQWRRLYQLQAPGARKSTKRKPTKNECRPTNVPLASAFMPEHNSASESVNQELSGAHLMTRAERGELLEGDRLRSTVATSKVDEQANKLRADVEEQLSAIFSFDQNTVWAAATRQVEEVVKQSGKQIAERCHELGTRPASPRRASTASSAIWLSSSRS